MTGERGINSGAGTKYEYLCRSQTVDGSQNALAEIRTKFAEQYVSFSITNAHTANSFASACHIDPDRPLWNLLKANVRLRPGWVCDLLVRNELHKVRYNDSSHT